MYKDSEDYSALKSIWMEEKLQDRVFRFTFKSWLTIFAITICLFGSMFLGVLCYNVAVDYEENWTTYLLILCIMTIPAIFWMLSYINRLLIVTGKDIYYRNIFRRTREYTWNQVTRITASSGRVNSVKIRTKDGNKISVSSDMVDFWVMYEIGRYYNLFDEKDNVKFHAIESGVNGMLKTWDERGKDAT